MQNTKSIAKKVGNKNVTKHNKWGIIFLIPFFVAFIIYQLIPLGMTFYNSLFIDFRDGLTQIRKFNGIQNYVTLLVTDGRVWKYLGNTAIMWIMGFVPQIIVSLVLAQWFSDQRLKLKGSTFFKTVIYLPNLIMASAFSMLFYALFSIDGPINQMLLKMGTITKAFDFFANVWATRSLVAFMNFLMWFGNTTILLMAGVMGIDYSLYEAAEVDGANSWQRFTRITLPLLKPILIYVVITSLIGGIQMFDVPQILTNRSGNPLMADGTPSSMTLIMFLDQNLTSKNLGVGGALSVILFLITGALSLAVYSVIYRKKD